jgi:DNA-directed RNA polymerase subunit alpha
MEDILLPSKIEITPGETEHQATLTVEPCWHGYGTTLGNALRRVLLSSLPGAAVTAVKIDGIQHEFMAVPGVKEDALEVILNLKQLRLKCHSNESVRLTLKSKGEGTVTAGDIDSNADVEIANPELHLATLTDKKSELKMEIVVGNGRGYVTTEERGREKAELGLIAIDALYSPVKEVGYRVENVRVGEITNYDKLIMDIQTDGTIAPADAVDMAVQILLDHFQVIIARGGVPAEAPAEELSSDDEAEVEETPDEPEMEEEKPAPKKKRATKKAKADDEDAEATNK